jgi:hypothetical protein
MKNLIRVLKNAGFDVRACCCGHFKYSMTIVCFNKILNKHFDLLTLKDIPRGTKFYKKDKQGYYFIPEVQNDRIK